MLPADFITELFLFPFFMVFLRLGTAIMIMPALSDNAIPVRARVLFALMAAFVMFPALQSRIPDVPASTAAMVIMALGEMFIGLLMAIGARLFLATMSVAGDVLSFMIGFQAATLFDPRLGGISTAPALFLTLVGSMLVLATGLHLVMIEAIFESYQVLPVGYMPLMGDVAASITQLITNIYVIGLKIAAPVITVGFLTYMAFGLLNRLVPQVQAFFVALPLTIMVGLFVLGVSLTTMLTLFSDELFNNAIILNQTQSP